MFERYRIAGIFNLPPIIFVIKNLKKHTYLLVFIGIISSIPACVSILPDAHKIDIHQGNVIDDERLAQLERGMSQEQVRFLLGTPVNGNVFHSDRWDYLHYVSKAGSHAQPKRVSIFFEDGVVSRIEDHYSTTE